MINPYKDKAQKMTGGVDNLSRTSGDLKFHLHQGINPKAATRWQQFYSEDILSGMTRELAKRFDY